MPRYIVERTVGQLTQDEWNAVGEKATAAIRELGTGVVWIRSYISHAEGKVYCEYEAPSIALVLEHARRAGLPADRVSEISMDIDPSMFV